jgi:hypothetical protein
MSRTASLLLGFAAFCLIATAQAQGPRTTPSLNDGGPLKTHLTDGGPLKTHLTGEGAA